LLVGNKRSPISNAMIARHEFEQARNQAATMLRKAGIVATDREIADMDVADFGLGRLSIEGAQIVTLVQTERIAARVIVLFPGQTLPEHRHLPGRNDPGKEEVVRGIWGTVRVYSPGQPSINAGSIPSGKEALYTVRHETILRPGEQILLSPGDRHWFQAGEEGAVLYSFSTSLNDAVDEFTDPRVVRKTRIAD